MQVDKAIETLQTGLRREPNNRILEAAMGSFYTRCHMFSNVSSVCTLVLCSNVNIRGSNRSSTEIIAGAELLRGCRKEGQQRAPYGVRQITRETETT